MIRHYGILERTSHILYLFLARSTLSSPRLRGRRGGGGAALECLLTFFLSLLNIYSLQEILGGNAVSDEYAIGRHVANLFVTQTYEGQSDIHSQYFPFTPSSNYICILLCVYIRVVVEDLH